jgi:hypothetical protein
MTSSNIFLLSLAASTAFSQFVPAPTGLINATGYLNIPVRYKEVPTGICELDPSVRSYSGYVDVSEGQHYFFWFLYDNWGLKISLFQIDS